MATNVTNGDSSGLVEVPADREFSTDRGYQADIGFEGPKAAIDSKFIELIGLGYSPVRQTYVGGDLWRVIAQNVPTDSDGDPEPATPDDLIKTVWTCPGNMLEKDVWDLPKIQAAFAQVRTYYTATPDIGTLAIGLIRKMAEAWVNGETSFTFTNTAGEEETEPNLTPAKVRASCIDVHMDSTHAGYIVDLMHSMARGTTKFPVSQWVARRVMTGPLTSSLRGVRTNVNRMVTSAYLTEVEGMPDNLLDGIVEGYWLKQTPNVDREGNLLKVTNEWWWAEEYDRFTLLDPIDAP